MEHKIYNTIMEHERGGKMKSKKIGRPLGIDGKKEHDVKVRFDDKTHNELLNYCEKKSLTKSEAIRQGVNLLLKK